MENETLQSINNRRSTRKYKQEQIREEEVQTILDAAIQAPSARNLQPWHFTVIQNKELIDFISQQARKGMIESGDQYAMKAGEKIKCIFHQAPTVVIVSGKKDVSSALVDCSAAIENMLIAAESINVGSLWVGFTRFFFKQSDQLWKLELPDGYEPFYGVALGYKENNLELGSSKRNKDVIHYIRGEN